MKVPKKKKKKTLSKARKDAWIAFSKYIRLRDAIKTTHTRTHLLCITCGKRFPAFGVGSAQAGHFIPGRSNAVLLDEEFVHGQCYVCNCILNGNWVAYEKAMLKMWGAKKVAEAKLKKVTLKFMDTSDWEAEEQKYLDKFDKLMVEFSSLTSPRLHKE